MTHYALDALAKITGLAKRTIRFYIQNGLIAHPEGERRGAYYLDGHLEALLRIKRLTAEGFSLERVKALLAAPDELPREKPAPGRVSVRSHVYIAPGVELSVDPLEAALTASQMRRIVGRVLEELSAIHSEPKD